MTRHTECSLALPLVLFALLIVGAISVAVDLFESPSFQEDP